MNIILGSSSERRKIFFSLLFKDFFVIEPTCNEKTFSSVKKTVYENSKNKLFSILKSKDYKDNFQVAKGKDVLIVTADTVVYKDKKIYLKPSSPEEAFNILKSLNGQKHSVFSGVSLFFKNKLYYFYDKTDIYFNFLSDNILKNYINTFEPFDAAGAYKIQGSGSLLVKRIKGSISNVAGFPVEKFLKYYNRFICYSKEEVSIVSTTY